ncbi:MAG: twin-arginine translocase TatA/TatE family subunit [Pelagibacteraceae bacterium]|nr:twin-arginine translocase TatA/TatE family subunit [Pelagibacteraceae bacterium]|tara:strand:- start:781 stop:936 length:156 start_codon:yes stop_codon:yes gene_type:complete
MAPSFWQILLVLVIILILFGAGKLPVVIKQLGKGLQTLRSSLKEGSKKRKK